MLRATRSTYVLVRSAGPALTRILRLALVAAVVSLVCTGPLAVASGSATPASSATDVPPTLTATDSWAICHATNSDSRPYGAGAITPNVDGVLSAHLGDAGPVWNATLKADHVSWGDIVPPFVYQGTTYSRNWDQNPAGQAIFDNNCQVPATVAPVAPTVTQALCGPDDVVAAPVITPAATPTGVAYALSPATYAAGDTVTVTATVTGASVWFQWPGSAGWTFVDVHTETYTVNLNPAPTCGAGPTALAPQDPAVNQSVCGSQGVAVDPTLTLPPTTAVITYAAEPAGGYHPGDTVTVTATIADAAANAFAGTPPGAWVYDSATTAHLRITFAAAPTCQEIDNSRIVAAADPTFADAVCKAGAPTTATYTVAAGTQVRYLVDGAVISAGSHTAANGSTVTITAEPEPGFEITGTATWTHTFAATPVCQEVLAETITPGGGTLANTGAGPLPAQIAWGLALLVLGLGALLLGRPRSIARRSGGRHSLTR